jgi:hypothetical protein
MSRLVAPPPSPRPRLQAAQGSGALPAAGVACRADAWTQFRPADAVADYASAAGSQLDTTLRFQDLGAPRIPERAKYMSSYRTFPANDRAALRGIILKLDFNSQLGSEISYLRGRDKFGRIIEDDALDLVANISPIKDVGKCWEASPRRNDQQSGIMRLQFAVSRQKTAAGFSHQCHGCRARRCRSDRYDAILPQSVVGDRDEMVDSARETRPSDAADRTRDAVARAPARPSIAPALRR